GVLFAISENGDIRWSYTAGVAETDSYSGPAIGGDGTIYLPANDGALHAIRPDGTPRWRYQPLTAAGEPDASGIFTSPALDGDGNIYVATLNGAVFSLTPAGTLRWVFRTPDDTENVTSSLALGDGRAYFASYGAWLYAIDLTDGTEIWKASIEAQARASAPAIADDGSIIVGSYANKLFRFTRDGDLI